MAALLGIALASVSASYASAETVTLCQNKKTGATHFPPNVKKSCSSKENKLALNTVGATGAKGEKGDKGKNATGIKVFDANGQFLGYSMGGASVYVPHYKSNGFVWHA